MPIPKEILAVERPTNTVVYAYGKNKDRYGVRKRTGCRRDGKRSLPVNGPTVGHIVDGRYVPIAEDTDAVARVGGSVDLRDWADVTLAMYVAAGLYAELLELYNEHDANVIICMAILRVVRPGIKDCELKAAYDQSFLSEYAPGTPLSKNSVCTFLNDLGKSCSRIQAFMRNRAGKVGIDHHLLVDGTLKSDESSVNTLSDFSRKARTKGTRDISVVYAFDLEERVPVCSKCYPGNMPDCNAYEDFVSGNGIKRGLIVADKGIPSSMAAAQFEENEDLHYLNPLRRNTSFFKTHDLLSWQGMLPGHEGVTWSKAKVRGKEKWLYCFRDGARAAAEEHAYLRNARRKGTFDDDNFKARQAKFGTVVFECDLDLPPETVYEAYSCRWEIELVMRYYKSACQLDETRVHDDYSVIGSEFVNFLATVITFRLLARFDACGLLERDTYKQVMMRLRRAKMARPAGGEWQLINLNPSYVSLLQELGLLEKPKPKKRGRGRPRKS